jgi:hypothetical protein
MLERGSSEIMVEGEIFTWPLTKVRSPMEVYVSSLFELVEFLLRRIYVCACQFELLSNGLA